MIRVVYVEPGKAPEIRMIEPTLETYQQLVGGYVEARLLQVEGLDRSFLLFMEEDARLKWDPGKPLSEQQVLPNRWVPGLVGLYEPMGPVPLLGSLLVLARRGEDEESLTEEEAQHISSALAECDPVAPDEVEPGPALCFGRA